MPPTAGRATASEQVDEGNLMVARDRRSPIS